MNLKKIVESQFVRIDKLLLPVIFEGSEATRNLNCKKQ